MTKISTWEVMATDGISVSEQDIVAVGPHHAGMLALVGFSLEANDAYTGVIVRGADSRLFTVGPLASPEAAYMSVDYEVAGAAVDSPRVEVATFMSARVEERSTVHRLMCEHIQWFGTALPEDLVRAFPLTDDDGSLARHKANMRAMATAVAVGAEADLAKASASEQVRRRAMLQLQMAAYMSLRPGVLLALLLAGGVPAGAVSRVAHEHLMSELELY